MSATDRYDPSAPKAPAASRHPGGRTPSCLPSRATKIFAFCSPNPGSAATRFSSSAPEAAVVQTAAGSPPYVETMSRARSWVRAAIALGNRCRAGRSPNFTASSSGL